MKTIKIAHLYYNLMNLYGETGNVLALNKAFNLQGLKVEIDNLSIEDKLNLKEYDIIYIGTGNEYNFNLVNEHLKKYKKDLKELLNNKTIIATGNALTLFGTSLDDIKCLGLFDFKSSTSEKRIVGEIDFKSDLYNEPIIGFQNRQYLSIIEDGINNLALFKDKFYGSYLIGPLLIRNPKLLLHIVKEVCETKSIKYKDIDLEIEEKAYNEYIKNFKIK